MWFNTPGLNPGNLEEIDALQKCLVGIDALETHLVLSATTKESDLSKSLKVLNQLSVAGLIFTKLDESGSYGNLINFLSDYPIPVSYLTSGRQVPSAVNAGSLEKMAELLLGDFSFRTVASDHQVNEPSNEPPDDPPMECRFVANKNSDVYHCVDCKWTRKIIPKNLITFSSAEVARTQQFMPCRDCQPDKSETLATSASVVRDSVRISNYS